VTLRCDRCRRLVGARETLVPVSAAAVYDDSADPSGVYQQIAVSLCPHCERDVTDQEPPP